MAVSAKISVEGMEELKKTLSKLDLKKHDKELIRILKNSAKPVIKAAQSEASAKIKNTKTFIFKRKGTKYTILPGTIRKSIGVLSLKRVKNMAIYVGYRAKSPYDAWFAHYVDAGTPERQDKKGAKRGKIAPRNIMKAGENGLPLVDAQLKKEIEKLIKKYSK